LAMNPAEADCQLQGELHYKVDSHVKACIQELSQFLEQIAAHHVTPKRCEDTNIHRRRRRRTSRTRVAAQNHASHACSTTHNRALVAPRARAACRTTKRYNIAVRVSRTVQFECAA